MNININFNLRYSDKNALMPSPISLNIDKFSAEFSGIYNNLQEEFGESEERCWLEKKNKHPPYPWQKRWVIIQDGYLLWCERQITVGLNGVDDQEKKRWNKCIPIKNLVEVSAIKQGKTQTKFIIKALDEKGKKKSGKKGKTKEYIWKAGSEEWRDRWVIPLNEWILR